MPGALLLLGAASCAGVAAQSWVVGLGVAALAAIGALFVYSARNDRVVDYVAGTARVVRWTEAGRGCELELVVQAQGMKDVRVKVSEERIPPWWPRIPATLPIIVTLGYPRSVWVLWDLVQPENVVPKISTQGTVKWYNRDKGFGFITPDDSGPDLFVHFSQINFRDYTDSGRGTLDEGQRVEFWIVQGKKGPQAENVRPI